MVENLKEVDFKERLVFGDESKKTNSKVKKHNVRIWDEENLRATVEHGRNFKEHLHVPSFSEGNETEDV